jgi:hypothetical protein
MEKDQVTPPLPDRIAAAIEVLVDRAAVGRGVADARCDLRAAIAEVVAERDAAITGLTNVRESVRELLNERDAATKRADGLAEDNAAQLAAGKALYQAAEKLRTDLAAAQAYRDSMVAAFAKLYGPEVPIDEHAATLGRLIADSHTLADIAVELMDTEHGAEGSLAEAVRVLVSNLAAAQAKLAEVDRKRQILADIAVEAAGWLAGLAGRPSCSCDPGDLVKRLLDTAQSGQPAQRDDDGTASGGGAQ